jgi:hypothetical protein
MFDVNSELDSKTPSRVLNRVNLFLPKPVWVMNYSDLAMFNVDFRNEQYVVEIDSKNPGQQVAA